MKADPDFDCAPAPAPAQVPQEVSVKTEIIERHGGGPSKTKGFGLFLLGLALLGGVGFAIAAQRSGGSASASAEVVTGSERAAENVATATGSGEVPAECVGDIVDEHRKWYCTDFLSFAKIAVADHSRIDRLEAAGKNPRDSGVPLALWVVLAFIGVLTVYNTVKIVSKKEKPPTGQAT